MYLVLQYIFCVLFSKHSLWIERPILSFKSVMKMSEASFAWLDYDWFDKLGKGACRIINDFTIYILITFFFAGWTNIWPIWQIMLSGQNIFALDALIWLQKSILVYPNGNKLTSLVFRSHSFFCSFIFLVIDIELPKPLWIV